MADGKTVELGQAASEVELQDNTIKNRQGEVVITVSDAQDTTFAGAIIATGLTIGSAVIVEAELEILDGATLSTTELNYVGGVSSAIQTQLNAKQTSAADLTALSSCQSGGAAALAALTSTEIGIIDGATLSTTELNYVDGVSSSIQTQLGTKQAVDADLTDLSSCQSGGAAALALLTSTEIAVLDGATLSTAELNVLDGYTGSVTELNYLDTLHATDVTNTEFDYLDGVTSSIQTQLDAKISATLTDEQVEDYVGAMVTGNTETFIAVTYEDGDGTLDFVVPVLDEDGMGTDSASHLATQQSIKAYVDASGGGSAITIQPISASATATLDTLVVVNSSGGVVTVTLPAVSGNTGKFVIVKARHGAANAVTVTGNLSETIDGAANQSLDTNMASIEMICDGTTWWIR